MKNKFFKSKSYKQKIKHERLHVLMKRTKKDFERFSKPNICSKCNKNDLCVYCVRYTNGEKEEYYYCWNCLKEMGLYE